MPPSGPTAVLEGVYADEATARANAKEGQIIERTGPYHWLVVTPILERDDLKPAA